MHLHFEGKEYPVEAGETVLDCLERGGAEVPSLCRSGACQTCLLKSPSDVPSLAQLGLKQAWRQQGVFLSCQCHPAESMEIERTDVAQTFRSRVLAVERLAEQTFRLWLKKPDGFSYEAGQFVQLRQPEGELVRPYSLASTPSQERLEFHVRVRSHGHMSLWLKEASGQEILLTGPFGDCVYLEGDTTRSLLLAGTGTGLAPLLGIIRAALEAGHQGPIRLFHGSYTQSGLYLINELQQLAARNANLEVKLCATEIGENEESSPGVSETAIMDSVLQSPAPGANDIVYLCGNPEFVRTLKKKLYIGGCSLSNIYSDPFVAPAEPRRSLPADQ